MQSPSPYRPPEAELAASPVPSTFYDSGLSARYFYVAAGCAGLSLALSLVDVGLGFVANVDQAPAFDPSALLVTAPAVLLGCYALLALNQLFIHRLAHQQSTWPIRALVVVSILSVLPAPFLAGASEFVSWPWMLFYGFVFVIGILSCWLGAQVVRLRSEFSQTHLFGWAILIAGICYVTVVLAAVGALAGVVASVTMVAMLWRAGSELAAGPPRTEENGA